MVFLHILRSFVSGWSLPICIAAIVCAVVIRQQEQTLTQQCSLLKSGPSGTLILRSNRVVTPKAVVPADVTIQGGKIVAISPFSSPDPPPLSTSLPSVDYGSAVISPGLVDLHVHLNDPGRVHWEGFVTGTMAAAAGGVTTLVDMPLNCVPTTTNMHALQQKIAASRGRIYVDVGFWGGLVPENAHNATTLQDLIDAGVLGFKSFMCPSGINDFPDTSAAHFEAALPVISRAGLPLLLHAEIPQPADERAEAGSKFSKGQTGEGEEEIGGTTDAKEKAQQTGTLPSSESMEGFPSDAEENSESSRTCSSTSGRSLIGNPRRSHAVYEASRPPSWERAAIQVVTALANHTLPGQRYHGAKMHIVHLSDAGSLPLIDAARESGSALTVETCPHYLSFASETVPDGDTRFKCAPPIRSDVNRRHLIDALFQGRIQMMSSDHSPSDPTLKRLEDGDFAAAWGGIAGLQFSLPATWTATSANGIAESALLVNMARWWSEEPARLAGLRAKGAIEVGRDADLVVWRPDESFVVGDGYTVFHRHKVTPYEGRRLLGKVASTFVRGQMVFDGERHAQVACGKLLLRQNDA